MHPVSYSLLFLLVSIHSGSYVLCAKFHSLQKRQNMYAEPWEPNSSRVDASFSEESECECIPVTQCGASLRKGDEEENMCPNDGDVCCILKGGKEPDEGGEIRDLIGPNAGSESVSEAPQHCSCIPITQCGASLRQGDDDYEQSEENYCANPGEVCCEDPKGSQEGGSDGGDIPQPGYGGDHIDEPPNVDDVSYLQCGEAQAFPTVYASMEVTERHAKFGELPWTVLLYVSNPEEENNGVGDYKCAGSLVHPKLVITAAHCIDKQDINTLTVRAGEWDLLSTTQEPHPYQESSIEDVKMHPMFVSGVPPFDLAVLILQNPFELTPNINVICLPNYSLDEVDINSCVSAGWGKGTNGLENSVLKKVPMPIVGKKSCQAALRKTRLGRFFVLHKSFLCAGGRADQDVCQGDGGGPLSCKSKKNGAMVLVGVTSWGVGCGKDGIPGVFADVLYLNNWLNEVLLQVAPSEEV